MHRLCVPAPRPFPAWRGSGRSARAGNRSRRGTAHRSGRSRCRSRNARRCAGCRRPRRFPAASVAAAVNEVCKFASRLPYGLDQWTGLGNRSIFSLGNLGFPRKAPWPTAQASEPPGTSAMTNRHWSTRDVPARHQFAYWREAVCEAVMNVATEDPADDDFSGNIACAGYGELRFATFTSSAHRIVRRPAPYRTFEPRPLSRQPAAQRHRPHGAEWRFLRIAGRRYRHRGRRAAVQRHLSECGRSRHRRDPVGVAAQPRALAARAPDRRDDARSRFTSDAARHHRAAGGTGLRLGFGSRIAGRQSLQSGRAADARVPTPSTSRRRRGSPISTACWLSCAAISAIRNCRRRRSPNTCRCRCARSTSASRPPKRRSAVRCSTFGWMPAGARSPIRAAAA